MALLVIRHANAGRRSTFKGDDRLRPLSARGRQRALDLVPLLARYRTQRILSSPYVRCCETVQPLAQALGIPVESMDELAEGNGPAAVRLMQRMAGESAVLCTHGDVATQLVESLAPDATSTARVNPQAPKGRGLGHQLDRIDPGHRRTSPPGSRAAPVSS